MEEKEKNNFDFMSLWRNTSFIITLIILILALLYKFGILKPS